MLFPPLPRRISLPKHPPASLSSAGIDPAGWNSSPQVPEQPPATAPSQRLQPHSASCSTWVILSTEILLQTFFLATHQLPAIPSLLPGWAGKTSEPGLSQGSVAHPSPAGLWLRGKHSVLSPDQLEPAGLPPGRTVFTAPPLPWAVSQHPETVRGVRRPAQGH